MVRKSKIRQKETYCSVDASCRNFSQTVAMGGLPPTQIGRSKAKLLFDTGVAAKLNPTAAIGGGVFAGVERVRDEERERK